MNHRVVAGLLCLIAALGILTGYLLLHPTIVGLCTDPNNNCLSEFWRYGVAKPLFWGTQWLPFFFFALIFVRKEVFQSWWKFGALFAILPLLLIIVSPPLGEMFTPDRTLITERMVQLFVIASAIFIGWKYWRISKR
ncbi:MAG: hypothetical protein Q7S50_02215 [bacterium]|nr:hypothetical protein [bacterium]